MKSRGERERERERGDATLNPYLRKGCGSTTSLLELDTEGDDCEISGVLIPLLEGTLVVGVD